MKKINFYGFVEILELGGVTAYTETVIPDEEVLPAAEVYPRLPALGKATDPALLLQVLQAHLHPAFQRLSQAV